MPAGRVRSGLDIQTLSVLPDASQLCLTVDGNEAAFAVLSAPPPVTLEAPLVRPCEDTEALFFCQTCTDRCTAVRQSRRTCPDHE